jgi:hypothetical protein
MTVLALLCVLAGRLATADAAAGKPQDTALRQVVYPVADLVVPIDMGDEGKAGILVKGQPLHERLMQLISSTVAPASWKEHGGRGTLQFMPLGMALVITQTPEVHGEVADLLKALRRVQDIEVAVELRVVTLSPAMAAEFRAKAGFDENGESGAKRQATAFFTDKELYPWLRLMQGDAATNIMMSPKITVFDGQAGKLMVSTTEQYVTEYKVVREGKQAAVVPQVEKVPLGMTCTLQPTISADRRFVRMKLDFQHTSLQGPVQVMRVSAKVTDADGENTEFIGVVQQPEVHKLVVKQACTIPDGRTMVIAVGDLSVEERSEIAPPVLRDVPFLRRLVTSVGYGREKREMFLFVTPRIIVNEEEEFGVEFQLQTPVPNNGRSGPTAPGGGQGR